MDAVVQKEGVSLQLMSHCGTVPAVACACRLLHCQHGLHACIPSREAWIAFAHRDDWLAAALSSSAASLCTGQPEPEVDGRNALSAPHPSAMGGTVVRLGNRRRCRPLVQRSPFCLLPLLACCRGAKMALSIIAFGAESSLAADLPGRSVAPPLASGS